MLKLAVVTPAYMPAEAFGGPVRAISAISRVLEENDCSVRVFTTDILDPTRPNSGVRPPSYENVQGVPVERLRPVLCIAGYWITPRLFWRLMRENYDIIFAHCARSFQLDISTLVAFLRGKRLIVVPHGSIYSYATLQGSWTRPLYVVHNAILKLVFKKASKIVATSQEEVRQISRFMGEAQKIELIPNFIEGSEYSSLPSPGSFRQKYGLSSDAKMILFVGRLNRIKGVDTLVRAFARMGGTMNKVWLVLVGPDGGELDRILDLSKSMKCHEKTIFTGALYGSDKLSAFVDSDVVVMPSLYESFGIVALEAYACGKPVVGSKVGGLKELIIPHYTGLWFEPGDELGLCSTLSSILDKPDSLRAMGSNGRDYVMKSFSDATVGRRIIAMCEEITDKRIRR